MTLLRGILETPPYPEWHREYRQGMMPPNRFWGLITKNGVEVPDGQTVYGVFSTKDDAGNELGLKVRGKAITEKRTFNGITYNYDFNIPTEGTISGENGKLITFYLGSEKTVETANLVSELIIRLDLHLEETPPPAEFPWVLTTIIILGLGLVYVLASTKTP